MYHVPKVILYRMNKWSEGARTVEALIKISNPNMSSSYVTFETLEKDENFSPEKRKVHVPTSKHAAS